MNRSKKPERSLSVTQVILFFSVVAILWGVGYKHIRAKLTRIKYEQTSSLSIQSNTLASASSTEAETKSSSMASWLHDDRGFQKSDCKKELSAHVLIVDDSVIRQLYTDGTVTTISPVRHNCLQAGQHVYLFGADYSNGALQPFFKNRGQVKIGSLKIKKSSELTQAELLLAAGNRDHLGTLRALAPRIALVQISLAARYHAGDQSRNYPKIHPYAGVIDAKSADYLLRNGAIGVNLGLEDFFRHPLISASQKILFDFKSAKGAEIFPTFSSLKAIKFTFDFASVLSDRSKAIVIYGVGVGDIRVPTAIAVLLEAGFREIYWFQGGAEELLYPNINATLSANIPVRVVDAKEAKNLIEVEKYKIFDVRRRLPSRREEIPGSTMVQYVEALDLNGYPIAHGTDPRSYARAGDKLDFRQFGDRNSPILLYCSNERDVRCIKVSLWLKQSGYTKVVWLKEGLAGWKGANQMYGNFPTKKIKKHKQDRVAPKMNARLFDGTFDSLTNVSEQTGT